MFTCALLSGRADKWTNIFSALLNDFFILEKSSLHGNTTDVNCFCCVLVTFDFSVQVHQARLESEGYCLKLEMTQNEAREVKVSLEREKEQVRRELLGRLRELETLPDRLRRTEQQLRDVQQEADVHERRNMEHNSALSEVRHKVPNFSSMIVRRKRDVCSHSFHLVEILATDLQLVGWWCRAQGHQDISWRWISVMAIYPDTVFLCRWNSKALSWRCFSRGTCCCRRRTTFSKRKFTTWRGTDTYWTILVCSFLQTEENKQVSKRQTLISVLFWL